MIANEEHELNFLKKILLTLNHSAIIHSSSFARSVTILTGHALEGNAHFDPDFLQELSHKDPGALDMLLASGVLNEDEMSDAIEFYAALPDEYGFHADRLLMYLDDASPLIRWAALTGLGHPHHYKTVKVQKALNDIVMKQENGFFEELAKSILEDAANG